MADTAWAGEFCSRLVPATQLPVAPGAGWFQYSLRQGLNRMRPVTITLLLLITHKVVVATHNDPPTCPRPHLRILDRDPSGLATYTNHVQLSFGFWPRV